uniref:Uncharacterized protein n=1 Tax=Schlesneria paludicola TaxID=360056 RepID=A0A7C4QTA9_9PLAN
MPSRAVLERQLKLAEARLAECTQALQQGGCEAGALARSPQWRHAQASCTTLRRRLAAVAAIEANNAEVERRKQQPKVEEEPPPPPPPKAEAAKPAKKSKAAKA